MRKYRITHEDGTTVILQDPSKNADELRKKLEISDCKEIHCNNAQDTIYIESIKAITQL